jgi:hypothetical protein
MSTTDIAGAAGRPESVTIDLGVVGRADSVAFCRTFVADNYLAFDAFMAREYGQHPDGRGGWGRAAGLPFRA